MIRMSIPLIYNLLLLVFIPINSTLGFSCESILTHNRLNDVMSSALLSTRESRTDEAENGIDGSIVDGRRAFISSLSYVTTALLLPPLSASAKDELFKDNPLTNRFLEKIRIWEQSEADNINYGGELAPGSAKQLETKLLVPILSLESDIRLVDELIRQKDGTGLSRANKVLSGSQFQKLDMKKMFNAFADNIYYSDPDRANAYLAGGAVPNNSQSIAYLLRNDFLTNVENLQAEVSYILREIEAGRSIPDDAARDVIQYSDGCLSGMDKYLALVPPGELENARGLMPKKS